MNIPTEQHGLDPLMANEIDGEDYSDLLRHIQNASKLESLEIVRDYPAEGDTTVETLCTVDGVTFPVAFEYRSHSNVAHIEKAENGSKKWLKDILEELQASIIADL